MGKIIDSFGAWRLFTFSYIIIMYLVNFLGNSSFVVTSIY